jgi:exopolysaccharide biosynthesis operon protein EpsL
MRLVLSSISLLLVLAVLASSGPLWAAPEDTVQPYVSTSIMHDDNLLRLSSDQPAAADTIKQGTAGVKVDWRQIRQELILDVSINESRFSRFTTLNYQSANIQSRWNWQLGNSLSGDIGYNRSTSLGSFAELQQLAKNINTQQNEFVDGTWQVNPGWRLNGSLTHSNYSVASNSVYGNESINYTAGAYFTPPSGNEIGIRSSRQIQKYPVLQTVVSNSSSTLVDNGFTQDQLLATISWLYSGHIRVNGQAGMVNRNHNQLSDRDFNGKTMRGTFTWLASGKSQVNLVAWNEIDSYEDLTTSYTQSKGVSLGPTWNPTGKLGVSARVQHLKRDFLGDPLLKLYPWLLIPIRQDTVNSASISINYQPVRTVNISAGIQTESRSSNQKYLFYGNHLIYGNYDYVDKTISLNMSIEF